MADEGCAASGQASCCPECGATFECGIACGQSRCWCFDLPMVKIAEESRNCVCPQCLQKRAAQFLEEAQ